MEHERKDQRGQLGTMHSDQNSGLATTHNNPSYQSLIKPQGEFIGRVLTKAEEPGTTLGHYGVFSSITISIFSRFKVAERQLQLAELQSLTYTW